MTKKKVEESPQIRTAEITFDDIVGHKKAKERLHAIIRVIKNPQELKRFNTPPPKGLLIYGPANVGKSMLAQAFAKEAGMKYLELSGAKLFNLAYIREVYEIASKNAPAIVLLEDIDIKGLVQGTITHVSFADIAKILESSNPQVFTIATAEDFDAVDPILTAAGKLDFLLEVTRLDKEARRFFIEKILTMPHDPHINTERIVRYITGMSALELERLGRMTALSVVEEQKKHITEEILIEQINIIKYGHKIENKMIKNLEVELKMTAYHEAAHAVLSYLLLPDVKIEQVTIAPRSKMLGFVSYNADDQMSNVTKEEIFNDICVLLAGQMAKTKLSGDKAMDSGAINDLSEASLQAYTAITNLGMDKKLGFINLDAITPLDNYFLSQKVEKRFLVWMREAKKRTKQLVDEKWDKIEQLALALIEKEIIESHEIDDMMKEEKVTYNFPENI